MTFAYSGDSLSWLRDRRAYLDARFELTLQYLRSYVVEWFDQNPLGQVGIILMRDRLSEVLVPMGGELVV
jgi:hypothetical protein